jgi:REP element-mobilizing transposase RayT
MPRQARLDAPGTLHHVIIRGIEKRRIVDDDRDRNNFISRLGQIAVATRTSIYAWALMTNHAHILLSSGPQGLSSFMRRFMTGYAVNYNLRHRRYGHLFQNRYKSIVCDADGYFTELVRYIHLNPLRVDLVTNLSELERYPYCGHGVIVGKIRHDWQDRAHALSWFGRTEGEAKKAYRKFIKDGVALGRRAELVGGGLVRSMGGWSEVVSLRRRGVRELADERILGSGDFVERILKEADERVRQEYSRPERPSDLKWLIGQLCRKENVSMTELRSRSRRETISRFRGKLACKLIEEHGITMAEVARQIGMTTSGISKMLTRNKST